MSVNVGGVVRFRRDLDIDWFYDDYRFTNTKKQFLDNLVYIAVVRDIDDSDGSFRVQPTDEEYARYEDFWSGHEDWCDEEWFTEAMLMAQEKIDYDSLAEIEE